MKREADYDHFLRFYYLEAAIALWLGVGLSIMVFAVLVHINLNFVIGVCIMLAGIAFLATTLVGAVAWGVFGEYKLAGIMRVRRVLLAIKAALTVLVGGLSIWAAVIMFQRSIS